MDTIKTQAPSPKTKSLLHQLLVVVVSSLLVFGCETKESSFQLVIISTESQREKAPYFFTMPDSLVTAGEPYLQLVGTKEYFPIQQIEGNQWVFIPDIIPASSSATFELIVKQEKAAQAVELVVDAGKLNVSVSGNSVLTYQMETLMPPAGSPKYYQKGGFIHPAYSPAGQVITDGFPEGHRHQHGIFFAWVNTRFQGKDTDFWNQQDETGTVKHDSLMSYSNGPVFGEFTTAHTAVALLNDYQDTIKVLKESWKVRVYNISDYFLWDIEVNQENVASDDLEILKYHYGGMAFRGSAEWNDTTATGETELTGPGQGGFLTSEGLGRKGNHTRPDWVSIYGNVKSQPVHLAAMSHPKNYRSPQFTRIHPNMPYFCYLPMVDNGFSFKPGDVHKARFRVLTKDGDPDAAFIDRISDQYQKESS